MLRIIKLLLPYIRPNIKIAIVALLLSIPLALIKGFQASLAKDIFDKGLDGDAALAKYYAGVLLALGLINYPFRLFHFSLLRNITDLATCRIRNEIYVKLQKLPLNFFQQNKMGNLISSMLNDTQILSQGFRNLVDSVREPLIAITMLGIAFYRDWQLTIVVLAVTPLFLIIFQKSGKKVRAYQNISQDEMASMTHNIAEGLGSQKIAKAFNLQKYILNRFDLAQNKYLKSIMNATWVEENAHPLVELVGAIAFSGVILFANHRIRSGEMTPGDFVSFIAALALLMDPIRKFSQANVKLNQARAAGERIQQLMSNEDEIDSGTEELNQFNDSIEIKNITFKYGDDSSPVLRNFSLSIKKGEKVALVGLSGSGKSTIVNLLLRLYPLQSGSITIDGISIEKIKLDSLRRFFGYVSQDLFLFNDTVLENMTLGKEYSRDDIEQALEISGVKNFLPQLSHGENTLIGDRGTKLSGGQCQRIAIARVFLRGCSVYLFDEATSALDNESEKLVNQSIERVSQDKSVLSVAHRLTTVQNYHKIALLKDGMKVEEGDHAFLMERQGDYSRLYRISQQE